MTKHKQPAQILHFDLFGRREDKYNFLTQNTLQSVPWTELRPEAPNFFLVKKDFGAQGAYEKGFKIDELFPLSSSGIKTHRDDFIIDFDKSEITERIKYFLDTNNADEAVRTKFQLKDNRDWYMSEARKNNTYTPNLIQNLNYRPFDTRYIYYDSRLIDFGREKVMQHLISGSFAFVAFRQSRNGEQGTFWLSKYIVGKDLISSLDTCTAFPLYLYPDSTQSVLDQPVRTPNLNLTLVQQIAEGMGLRFTPEKETEAGTFSPIDLLDYIYAVLHAPSYRETYKEFLKIDFPRVPYPRSAAQFWALVALGSQLRQVHLLESPVVEQFGTQYPEDGDNVVRKLRYEAERVYINDTQYFAHVPEVAWNFYIGGYQPAQKWLKDRKDRELGYEDILHYQKIVTALRETARLMGLVDAALVE